MTTRTFGYCLSRAWGLKTYATYKIGSLGLPSVKRGLFLKNEYLTPPPYQIKIPPLSTESRELAFLNWLGRRKDRRSSVFFYSRKTANLPFAKILVKAQWWTVWEIERSPFTLINGTPILNSSSPTNWRLFVMISKTLIRESQNDKLKLNSCF